MHAQLGVEAAAWSSRAGIPRKRSGQWRGKRLVAALAATALL